MTTVNALTCSSEDRYSSLVSIDGRTYPLKSANINARAEGGIAFTTLTQIYENPYTEALEVFYTLPLPADGAVAGYTIRMGKRVIRGEVQKREQAKEEYRKALFEGRTAALLEQERADTFSQSLGCVPPGETVTVEIDVLHQLAFLPGTKDETACWEYRFPTVVGVRYEGEAGRVPDAAKLDVDRASEGTPVRLAAIIQIADGPAGKIRPYSPDQELKVHENENGATVALEKGMSLDRDLVIRWTAGKQETGVRTVEGKGLSCDGGRYLLITLTPPLAVSAAIPRDLTMLIDASGSMSGQPLEQAKAVAIELLRSLDPGDRFEILTFANKVRHLISGPVDANDKNVSRALAELRNLSAAGSTEMTEALIEALKPLRQGTQRQVILLSDGQIGFEREVIGEIWRRLAPGARVHVVGVGSAPNRTLTRGAARAGRGIELIVGLDDDAQKAAARLLQATVRPVLTDLIVEGSGVVSFAPRKPRDVFAGQPSLIFAEVNPGGGRVQLSGRMAGSSSPWFQTLDIPKLQQVSDEKDLCTTSIPIGALFGRETIEDAEIDRAASSGDKSGPIDKRIESLGLRHGIPSRLTSLIAISEDTTVDPTDPRRRERLPVEVPAGVSAEGVGLIRGASPAFLAGQPALMSLSDLSVGEFSVRDFTFKRIARFKAGNKARMPSPPVRPIVIDSSRVLRIDDQILTFEFDVPIDGFMLPEDNQRIDVLFDDSGASSARILGHESSDQGPHHAGLTVRLALKLEGHRRWHHEAAEIHWRSQLRLADEMMITDVVIHIHLRRGF